MVSTQRALIASAVVDAAAVEGLYMARQEAEQGYAALVRAFLDGDPREHEGGPFDVRAVMACLPQETKDAFEYDGVPWEELANSAVGMCAGRTVPVAYRGRSSDPLPCRHPGPRGRNRPPDNRSWPMHA